MTAGDLPWRSGWSRALCTKDDASYRVQLLGTYFGRFLGAQPRVYREQKRGAFLPLVRHCDCSYGTYGSGERDRSGVFPNTKSDPQVTCEGCSNTGFFSASSSLADRVFQSIFIILVVTA